MTCNRKHNRSEAGSSKLNISKEKMERDDGRVKKEGGHLARKHEGLLPKSMWVTNIGEDNLPSPTESTTPL
jgi:hypothetical protein